MCEYIIFFSSWSVINVLTDNDQEYSCISGDRLKIGEHDDKISLRVTAGFIKEVDVKMIALGEQ